MSSEPPRDVFTYRLGSDEPVFEGVIKATAAVADTEPSELDPLYSVIEPDALDALFRPTAPGDATVRFSYNGYEIQVSSDRVIQIRPAE